MLYSKNKRIKTYM